MENSRTGEELYLLAQVNFAQIPHLPDYPEQGVDADIDQQRRYVWMQF